MKSRDTKRSDMDPAVPKVHTLEMKFTNKTYVSTEYFLPKPAIPHEVFASLPDWMQTVAMASSKDEVRALLVERWKDIRHPELQKLRDQLLTYEPVSIIMDSSSFSLLRLESWKKEQRIGSSAYLRVEPDPENLKLLIEQFQFDPNSVFVEFVQNFGGLREDFDSSGSFVNPDEGWETFDEGWGEDVLEDFEEWKSALLIYYARSGDRLLLSSSGQVAWFPIETREIKDLRESFAEFINFYVQFRNREPWPLDAWDSR